MKTILFLFLLLTFVSTSFSQSLEKADHFGQIGKHYEAIEMYKQINLYKLNVTQKSEVNKKLMLSYLQLFDYDNAYKVYTNSKLNQQLNLFSKNETYSLFQLLRVKNKYDEAEKIIPYLKLNEIEEDIIRYNFIEWPQQQNHKMTTPTIKQTDLISFGASYGLTFYKKNIIISNQNKEQDKTLPSALFQYEVKNDSLFLKKEKINKTKNNFYEGTPFYDQKKNEIYFSGSLSAYQKYKPNKIKKYNISTNGKNTLHLFTYNLTTKKTKHLPLLSNEYNAISPFLYNDSILFFSSNLNPENKLDLYYSTLRNKKWSKPILLSKVNTKEQELYPYIEGNNFYFSSRGHQNYGGLDIFECKFKLINGNPSFGEIKNIGKNINSSYDDFSMIIDNNKNTYFSSNRNGNDQIYSTIHIKNITIKGVFATDGKSIKDLTFSRINSPEKTNVIINQKNKSWSMQVNELDSTQLKIKGYGFYNKLVQINQPSEDSIYVIHLKSKKTDFILKDGITETAIKNALLTVFERIDDEWVKVYNTNTNNKGEWSFDFEDEKKYKVVIEAKNYNKKTIYIPKEAREFDDDDYSNMLSSEDFDFGDPNYNIEVNKLNDGFKEIDFGFDMPDFSISRKAKGTITINNIYFDYNSATITEESKPILNNLANYLKENDLIQIELSAHTDCVGGNTYNNKLSKNRANNCREYLIQQQIKAQRIKAIGLGKQKMLNSCTEQKNDPKKAQINRRIEVKILKK